MSKDAIYRQDAIDAFEGRFEITGRINAEVVKGYIRLVKDRIERLPAAEPRKGKWILTDLPDEHTYRCSECNEYWIFIEGEPSDSNANYCPNCGARMEK